MPADTLISQTEIEDLIRTKVAERWPGTEAVFMHHDEPGAPNITNRAEYKDATVFWVRLAGRWPWDDTPNARVPVGIIMREGEKNAAVARLEVDGTLETIDPLVTECLFPENGPITWRADREIYPGAVISLRGQERTVTAVTYAEDSRSISSFVAVPKSGSPNGSEHTPA